MKDHLNFDVTDANTIADTDSVGAFVRAGSDGALIASQSVNSQNWLNTASVLYDNTGAAYSSANPIPVDLVSPLSVAVDLDGFYTGSNLTPDSAGMILFSRAVAPGLSDQIQRPTVGGLASVLAADLTKVHAQDVNAFSYGLNATSGDMQLMTIDNGNGGLNVNILAIPSVTVSDAALANTAILSGAKLLAAGGTGEAVVTSALSARKYLSVYNMSNRQIFIGASGVTVSNGFPVSPGSLIEMRAGASVAVNFVGAVTGQEIRTLELS
jgi:hypothetical protein